jgi:hypothetical protein
MGLGPAPEARAALPSASSPPARVAVEEEVSVDASAPASNKR